MKNVAGIIKVLALAWVLSALSGCSSSMMKPAEVIQASPEYAVVNFLRPSSFGGAIMFGMWDRENLVGILTSKNYIQYKARPGEHIFLARAENWSVIKANVLAGKTYYVLASPRMGWGKARVSLEVLKPDDKRIDEWMASLKPIAVDPAQRDAYVKERESSIKQAVENVQNGSAEFSIMNPEDGR